MSLFLVINDEVEDVSFSGFGQASPLHKTFEWRTDIVKYDSGIEQRNQILTRPIRHWLINWTAMDQAGRDKLLEMFHAARGGYHGLCWLDDEDFQCTSEQITTDGTSTTYQLQKTYYSGETYEWTETKTKIVPGTEYAPVVTHSVDGAQTEVGVNPPTSADEYYLDDTSGVLTWGASYPPSAGLLTCTYRYYFPVRFADSVYEDRQMHCTPVWDGSGLHIVEVLPTV